MTDRKLWMGCALAGVATLVVFAIIFPMFPKTAVGSISPYSSPIYAFEFARTPSDLVEIFGEYENPKRGGLLTMMNRGNHWDFLFMCVYTVFGALFGWAAHKSGLRLGRFIVVAAILAGLGDVVETRWLLDISAALEVNEPQGFALKWLWLPVLIKFAGIGVSIALAGYSLFRLGIQPWKIAGGVSILMGCVAIVFSFGVPGLVIDGGTAIGVGWLFMMLFAVTRAVKRPIPPRP